MNAVDVYDNLGLQKRPITTPAEVAFSTMSTQAGEGATATICVDITNPSSTFPTTVSVGLDEVNNVHFPGFQAPTLVFPAGSTATQCFTLQVPTTQPVPNDFFYDFTLQLGNNTHPVQIGGSGMHVLQVTQANTISIDGSTVLSATEGQSANLCVRLARASTTYTTVELYCASPSPHLASVNPIVLSIPPGQTSVCQSVNLPLSGLQDTATYTLVLRNPQGSGVVIGSPQSLVLKVVPSNGQACWETVRQENFSGAVYANFSDMPHIVNTGFTKSGNGATGSSSDLCARATSMSGALLGFTAYLEAGAEYRLSWKAKTATYAKQLELCVGTTVGNAAVLSGPFAVSTQSYTLPAQALASTGFSVQQSGTYVIFLRKTAASPSAGTTYIDDLHLEENCQGSETELYFTQESYTATAGQTLQVCVGIRGAHPTQPTQVGVVLEGASGLLAQNSYTVTFPAGSAEPVCLDLPLLANGALDGDRQVLARLANPIAARPVVLAHPDSVTITVLDDVSPAQCQNWGTGYSQNFDNCCYYGTPPPDFSLISTTYATTGTNFDDQPGDRYLVGNGSGSFGATLTLNLQPGYEYRLKYSAKVSDKYGNILANFSQVQPHFKLEMAAPGGAFTVQATSVATNGSNLQAIGGPIFTVPVAGAYAFKISGTGYQTTSTLSVDDVVLEQRCLLSAVSVAQPAAGSPWYAIAEGSSLQLDLLVANPSTANPIQAVLALAPDAAPHFAHNPQVAVSIPAGATQHTVVVPSVAFEGADPRSEYTLQLQSVAGGRHATVAQPSQALVRVTDNYDCWTSLQNQTFATASTNLSASTGLVHNYSATRTGNGASGASGDYCARMSLITGKYLGFAVPLEVGKRYRIHWVAKSETAAKPLYFAVGTTTANAARVGSVFTLPKISSTLPGLAISSEYFTVPANGTYYLLLKSDDSNATYLRLDNFRLETQCPPMTVAFDTTHVSVQEGYPAQVCVVVDNPHPSQPATVGR